MVKFIVLATQRSGTVFLETILNSHPDIHCTGELLLYDNEGSFIRKWAEMVYIDPRNLTPKFSSKLLGQYCTNYFRSHQKKAVGFDIKYNQFYTIANMEAVLKKQDVRIIHLIRENFLKTFISLKFNQLKQELNRKSHGTVKVKPAKITLSGGQKLLKELALRESKIKFFSSFMQRHFPYLELHYEKFFPANRGEAQNIVPEIQDSILQFLGLPLGGPQLTTPYRKTNPVNLPDLLENYTEIYNLLINTRFAHLLDETSVSLEEKLASGEELFGNQQYANALEHFLALVPGSPANARLNNNLGVCYWQSGAMDKAKTHIGAAVALSPDNRQYQQNLAEVRK
ncbi:MAG: tetratricopeptide repeat protein [Candidatus Cloacimonetes bacterium]|nr:tetratricopeptide repeat protein [Candidatus Cloacimonadota bacterium]